MQDDWQWQENKKINLKKEGIYYELWKIWWAICTTGVKE